MAATRSWAAWLLRRVALVYLAVRDIFLLAVLRLGGATERAPASVREAGRADRPLLTKSATELAKMVRSRVRPLAPPHGRPSRPDGRVLRRADPRAVGDVARRRRGVH